MLFGSSTPKIHKKERTYKGKVCFNKKSMQFWSSTSILHRFCLLSINLSSLLIFYAMSICLTNKGFTRSRK